MKKLFAYTLTCLLIAAPFFSSHAQTDPRKVWDVAFFDQDGQITLFDYPQGASTTGKPTEMGDFNGNGCGDIAITGQNARGGNGQTRLVFDICDKWGNAYDLFMPDENTPPVLNLYGAQPGDMLGTEVYHGDFNGDGFDDLLISAQNATYVPLGKVSTGAAYIIFGREDLAQQPTIDMNAPPEFVMTIVGGFFEDRLGLWVEGGDFNGDGYHDALITASQADGIDNLRPNTGEAFIIWGAEDMLGDYGAVIDLSENGNAPASTTRFIGVDPDDLMGSISYGDDLNMDGLDDVILSAGLWRGSAGVGGLAQGGGDGPLNDRFNAGETFVIYGGEDLRGQTIDLATLIDETGTPIDERSTVIYGAEPNDVMGEEIIVGDLNGDGLNDLVLGSLATPSFQNLRPDGGEAWVIYNDENFVGAKIDLAEPGAGIALYGAEADTKGGDTMLIGDMDGDGIEDLLYGAPNLTWQTPDGRIRENTGVFIIIYGVDGELPTTDGYIDFAAPPAALRYDVIIGADPFDMSAYGVALYDLDFDGVLDIAMNGMNGDGPDNRRPDAGEIYVISGAALRGFGGAFIQFDDDNTVAEPTLAPTVQATPFPTNTPRIFSVSEDEIAALDGAALYTHNCAGCHGPNGEGIPGIAVALAGSEYIDPTVFDDNALFWFIRIGRTADHPASKMGRAMPASGGNENLTDAEVFAIIGHLRTFNN